MKIFISSLISGMQAERQAVRQALLDLGYQPVMAEDFQAQPRSSQVACLDGVRQSAAVVLIVGTGYGARQPSGLSATHEEYREARESRPVFAFVRQGVDHEPEQRAFLAELEAWDSGRFRGGFSSPEELRGKVVGALHKWVVTLATGPLDPKELLVRALATIPQHRYGHRVQTPTLLLAVAAGPHTGGATPQRTGIPPPTGRHPQSGHVRPSNLRQGRWLESGFGRGRLGRSAGGGGASVRLDAQGDLVLQLPAPQVEGAYSVVTLIQEDFEALTAAGLTFAAWLFNRIDPTQRLSHILPVATVLGASYQTWRTRAQQAASPRSASMRTSSENPLPVHLTPAHRPRPALKQNAAEFAVDLIALLRRQMKP
jgi:hypothetical protein